MTDMKISIRLRRKTGTHRLAMALCEVLLNNLLYKILRDRRLLSFQFHLSPPAHP